MPGGDRTGPLGYGPRTGRGMGHCSGNNQAGFTYPSGVARGGFGFARWGLGRGWRHRFFATGIPGWVTPTPEQETAELKAHAEVLKTQLEAIQQRIDEITS